MDQNIKDAIDLNNLPAHIAVIMDGNGRWAKQQGFKDRIFGHRNAISAVRETIEGCGELGVDYLTLYAFSTENWNRPQSEVKALMSLLIGTIHDELPTMMKNKVRLKAIGDIASMPANSQKELAAAIDQTAENTGLVLTIAANYGGRWDILNATRLALINNPLILPNDIDENWLNPYLAMSYAPEPDLFIRTGGEQRVSNFLLWHLAYTEMYFTDTFWPDFDLKQFQKSLEWYRLRERRFGQTGHQLLENQLVKNA